MSVTVEQRQRLRRIFAHAATAAQDYAKAQRIPVEEGMPEILGAVISISAYIARHGTDMTRAAFLVICTEAAIDEGLE